MGDINQFCWVLWVKVPILVIIFGFRTRWQEILMLRILLFFRANGLKCIISVAEVAGVTFSFSDTASVPKFWNPGPAIFQIWESDPCSDSGYNYQSNLNLLMFLLKKWPHRLMVLPKLKSDPGSGFSQIFDSGSWTRIWKRIRKFVKNRNRIWSCFSISAVAGVCAVISKVKTWVNYGWIDDCSQSLNRSRILKFEE